MVVFGTTYIAGCFDDVHPMMLLISPYQTMMVIASAMTCFCFVSFFFFFDFFSDDA